MKEIKSKKLKDLEYELEHNSNWIPGYIYSDQWFKLDKKIQDLKEIEKLNKGDLE